MNYEVLDPQ